MEILDTEIKTRIEMINKGEVPEGYKKTKVGIIPEDWEVKRLGEIVKFLDDKRVPIKEEDRRYMEKLYPYYGASGIIDYVDDYLFDEELILLGEDGANILTRSSRLAFLVSGKYWVNNHAHVMKGKECINQYFLAEKLESLSYKKYNTGTAQPKINQKTCSNIEIAIPFLQEQQKIAQILSTWDEAIGLKEKLIEEKKEQKKGLMQKLLTGEVRLSGFDGEWEEVEFNKIFSRIPSNKYQIKTKDYLEDGLYPVVDQGKQKIIAYSNHEDKLFKIKSDGVIVFGDHTREVKYIDFDFIIGADGTQLIKTKEGFDIKFYYYHLLIKKIPDTGYNRHFKFLKEMMFYYPPLPEQKAIAQILSTADKEIELLEKELELLKLQKKGLMQLLLTGIVRVN